MGNSTKHFCMQCMSGSYIGDRCPHCGAPRSMPSNPGVLPVGYLLHGRYHVGCLLGQGGFGITYVAWDSHTNRRVAIKELFPSSTASRLGDHCTVMIQPDRKADFSSMLRSFQREVSTLIQLQNHKGIVELYHMFEENGTAYYVMEYLDGQTLYKLLKKTGPMPWEQLRPVVSTILDALEQLHSVGVIHRDVSPDNIFVMRNGQYRLIDLGSARSFFDNSQFTRYVKFNFAPYEQFQTDSNQGPWTDIYSLCATCYYALTGTPPPAAPQRIISDTLAPLEQLCPGLPRNVIDAIQAGLALSWKNRCQSIPELRNLFFKKEASATEGYLLVCVSGVFQNRSHPLVKGIPVRIGRLSECEIQYPSGTSGVSRRQCTVLLQKDGKILVRDDGSSYGTYLIGEKQSIRLSPQRWYLADGCRLLFGQDEQYQVQGNPCDA